MKTDKNNICYDQSVKLFLPGKYCAIVREKKKKDNFVVI